ncbi:MAG: FKBP-type peptidyl-prolyl cis-trans isomerase [Candidatus Thiodiazotropha sp.]
MPGSPEIAPGRRVKMHFSLSLMDGTVALTTYQDDAPLEFTLGDGTLEPMLEYALLGLHAGDEQTLEVSGNEVYGPPDEQNIHWLERHLFPPEMELAEAQVIAFGNDQGESIPGVILQLETERVRVDFNHPLSGKPILYKVTILAVEDQD